MLKAGVQTRQETRRHWGSAHSSTILYTFPPAFRDSGEHGFTTALAGYRNNKATNRSWENPAAATSSKKIKFNIKEQEF